MEIKLLGNTQTKCLECSKKAMWTIGVGECSWSLCDLCCDELSDLTGEGNQYLDKISRLIDEGKEQR